MPTRKTRRRRSELLAEDALFDTSTPAPPPQQEPLHTAPVSNDTAGMTLPKGIPALVLPQFDSANPDLWFLQAEAQFNTRFVSTEDLRYSLIVPALPSNIATEVRDILTCPPDESAYSTLKAAILERVGSSQRVKARLLLASTELGDSKPSQLLRKMKHLLGEAPDAPDNAIIRELFMKRLPQDLRMILSTMPDQSLSTIAQRADEALESQPTAHVYAHRATQQDDLATQVSQLRTEVEALRKQLKPKPSSPRPPKSANTQPTSTLCWYHERFQEKATKCTPPCTYRATGADKSPTEKQ